MTESSNRRLVATTKQCYGGKWIKEGEEFEAQTDTDVDDLLAIKFAVRSTRIDEPAAYLRRDLRAEERVKKAR